MLPDDVLLEVFDFYLGEDNLRYTGKKELWIALAHACRRWRSLVFQSPHRLNLRLVCTPNTRARDTLDIWPPLPLIISDHYDKYYQYDKPANIIAALENNDRVCQIRLRYFTSSELEPITNSAAMQKPFPELTDLQLGMFEDDGPEPILPDSFLAGTAPRLRSLILDDIPFAGIPKLLLLATHLIHLDLFNIPPSGYIPPEAMATSLTTLTSLVFLRLFYLSPPPPDLGSRRQTPPPLTRSILPSLAEIRFKGASEYLEAVLARIDAPRVKHLGIIFFNQIIFDTPQLLQFISRRSTLIAPEKGHITFDFRTILVTLRSRTSDFGELRVEIPSTASEWQRLFLEQICTSSLTPLYTLEDLYIRVFSYWRPCGQGDVVNTTRLDLLRSFVAVKNLYLSERFMRGIAPTLQELVGGRTAGVLPTLENIFLQGLRPSEPLHEDIEKFVAARRLTNHPVTVSRWDSDSMQESF
jgi:hypothetical protein